jgi:hypothetical protein
MPKSGPYVWLPEQTQGRNYKLKINPLWMEEESSLHNVALNKKSISYLNMETESNFQLVNGNKKKNRMMDISKMLITCSYTIVTHF